MLTKGRINPEKFYHAILKLKTAEECAAFFEDVCTMQEIESMSQRFDVAIELYRGKSYAEINKIIPVSTATISRVNRALTYGDGGYRTVIERMEEDDD